MKDASGLSPRRISRRDVIAGGASLAMFHPLAAQAAKPVVVRVATLADDNTAAVFYAQELGSFKKYGLDVQLTRFTGGPAVLAGVTSGKFDVGIANVVTIGNARARGAPLRYIFPASIASATGLTNQITVARDSPIASAAAINGKIVGVNRLNDLQQVSAMSWIDKHGGNAKSVKFVVVPIPKMASELAANRIDVAMPAEPAVTASRSITRSLGNVLDGFRFPYMIIGWFSSDGWLKMHPDIAARFVKAMLEAANWGNANHEESAGIIATIYKIDPEITARMHRATYGTVLEAKLLKPLLDGALRYGMMPSPVAAESLVWTAPA